VRKLRVAREGIDAAHLFCPKPNCLINFLSRRAQTSENSVQAKFAESTLAELRWIENRPYNAWRLPEGLRSNPGAEDDAENQG
jgi:hypothetical protein